MIKNIIILPGRRERTASALSMIAAAIFAMTAASTAAAAISADGPSGSVLGLGNGAYVNTGVTAGDLKIAGNAARTFEAWVYTQKFNGGGVFSMGAPRRSQDFSLRTLGPDEWRIQYWASDVDFEHPTANRWTHMALVHTGEESIMYIDGAEVTRAPRELDTNASGPFRIGRWQDNTFAGRISEVRVWKRALTGEDIRQRMKVRLKGDETGLVGYWRLNEEEGTVAADLAGGNDGRLENGARWVLARQLARDLPPEKKGLVPGDAVVLGPVELHEAKGAVTYQWYFEGERIEGETGPTLTLKDMKKDKLGMYYVKVDDDRPLTPVESTHVKLKGWPKVDYVVQFSHPTMKAEVGTPAIIEPGSRYPGIKVVSRREGTSRFEGEIVREETGEPVERIQPRELHRRQPVTVTFPGKPEKGRYRLQLRFILADRQVLHDTYYFTVMDQKQLPAGYSRIVHPGEDGRLVYIPDYRGNRIPDFSSVGYRGGEEAIPDVPVKVTLVPEPGDNRERIQKALDKVGGMEPDENGFRGAVLLQKGVYEVRGPLRIGASGVVLRGEGYGGHGPDQWLKAEWLDADDGYSLEELKKAFSGREATVLVRPARATRHGILTAGGGALRVEEETKSDILDEYVPVGAVSFRIENPETFRVGDNILVYRAGNKEWIDKTGMTPFWSRGPRAFPNGWPYPMERTITAINGNRITIHSPIICAIEQRWGGGQVYRHDDSARISRVGFENMRVMLYSQTRGGRLSHLRGTAVNFSNVSDGWIRNVVAEHTCDRAFTISDSTRVTVRDCGVLLAPWRYFSGYVPRYGFFLRSKANHVLFEGCYANHTRHPFVLCAWVPGPNVFFDCRGYDNGSTGPHHRWSSGGLFDNIAVGNLELRQRAGSGSGHGWAGANFVAWNTSGRIRDSERTSGRLICERPPTAQNWSIGHIGPQTRGQLHDWNLRTFGYSFGYWESIGRHVSPQSLFLRQVEDRLGREAAARHRLHRVQ